MRTERRDLWVLSLVVLLRRRRAGRRRRHHRLTGLNPFIVGFHYVASLALVCVTAAFLVRMRTVARPARPAVPRWFAVLTPRHHVPSLAVTIAVGVLTTASGPHSGDATAGRTGFDVRAARTPARVARLRLFALTLVLVVAARRLRRRRSAGPSACSPSSWCRSPSGSSRPATGCPTLAVGAHVLAALLAAAMTVVVLRLKKPVTADAATDDAELAASAH